MIKLSFTIKCFVLAIICLIILSYYELENIKIKEEIKSEIETEDISEQFNTTMSYVSQKNNSIVKMDNTKIIYLVTQHDKKSQGKKQIKFSKGFFRQSKFKNRIPCITNALSFYRSQNILCLSKFLEPAKKFDCI